MDQEPTFLPLWHHFAELRSSLLYALAIITTAVIICFFNYETIISIAQKPLTHAGNNALIEERLEHIRIYNSSSTVQSIKLPTESSAISIQPGESYTYFNPVQTKKLVVLGPLEGILIAFKVSFWVGLAVSSPLWLYFIIQFIMPGLNAHEKSFASSFILLSLIFITAGCFFAFFITIPLANEYLLTFNQHIGNNLWSLENYLNYSLFLMLANAFAFELATIGIFAVKLGYISLEMLINRRRHAILGAFILGALMTPPDVLTQFMLAIPLIALYEGIILYARLTFGHSNMD